MIWNLMKLYFNLKSNSASAVNMMQGSAKLPTKVFNPLASTVPMTPNLPLKYLFRFFFFWFIEHSNQLDTEMYIDLPHDDDNERLQ